MSTFSKCIRRNVAYLTKLKLLRKVIGVDHKNTANNDLRSRYPSVRFVGAENISIGERVSIGAEAILAADAPIIIGDDTMVASRVIINTSTHSYKNNPMWKVRISRPIKIGKHVWIGSNTIILPGIIVGDYSVIGSGSIVIGHIPEKTIVAGNPARIIKYRELPPVDTSSVYPGIAIYKDYLPDDQICMEKKL